jgi:filamentous hemagglutinin family protein
MRSRLQTSRPLAALLFASVAASALAIAGPAMALPRGGEVVAASSGDGASISSSGNTMTIDQFSQKVVIDWASFNIGSSETVNFNQGGANFVAFNRIGSAQVTSINGAINAQGGVWLFAPGGLLFGKNAAVNVGSFVASTARLQNPEDVVNGNSISAPSNDGPTSLEVAKGAVINANNGFALLHSENLDQRGDVTASGSVAYVISEGFNLQYQGGTSGIQLVSFTPTSPSGGKPLAFNHTGATTAGGSVGILAPASAATPGFEGVINLGGIVQADAIGTGGVGLLINVGADAQGSTAPRLTLDASRGQIFTNGSASIAAWSLRLGDLSSGDLIANALTSLTLLSATSPWAAAMSRAPASATGP